MSSVPSQDWGRAADFDSARTSWNTEMLVSSMLRTKLSSELTFAMSTGSLSRIEIVASGATLTRRIPSWIGLPISSNSGGSGSSNTNSVRRAASVSSKLPRTGL